MKKADFQMVAFILILLGICFIALGVFALRYCSEWYTSGGGWGVYPYADYGLPFMAVGVIMLAVGLGLYWRMRQEH